MGQGCGVRRARQDQLEAEGVSDRPVLRALVAKTLPNGNVEGGTSFLPLEAAFQRVQDAATFGVPGVHFLRDPDDENQQVAINRPRWRDEADD